ncbi:MAG: SRPBCC family protein [Pseudolabrys sp.]
MKIEKTFDLPHPRELVWSKLNDVHFVAQCLPGASIVEDRGNNNYKGRMAVKVGPMAASFDGDIAIDSRRDDWTAVVSGKGSDTRSSSRASGSMTYKLADGASPNSTRVEVVSDINLAGPLAQFGKGGIIQEIANRITAEFIKNFEARLASASAPDQSSATAAPSAPQALDAGNLVWSVIAARIRAFFQKIFGS